MLVDGIYQVLRGAGDDDSFPDTQICSGLQNLHRCKVGEGNNDRWLEGKLFQNSQPVHAWKHKVDYQHIRAEHIHLPQCIWPGAAGA